MSDVQKGRQKRNRGGQAALEVVTVYNVDWEADRWAWAGAVTRCGEGRRQIFHAVTKREALAMTVLLQHWGEAGSEGESKLPPIALGLRFYRSSSIFRCHNRSTSYAWLGSIGNPQFRPSEDPSVVLPPPNYRDFGSLRSWLEFELPPPDIFSISRSSMSKIARAGQADILNLLLPLHNPPHGGLSALCRMLADDVIGRRRNIGTTARLLLERHIDHHRLVNSNKGPDFALPEYHGIWLYSLASQDPDLVVLAMELWPEITTEYLMLPFSENFDMDCATRVLLQTHPKPIDWWEILDAAFDMYTYARDMGQEKDDEVDKVIEKLINKGAKIPQGYELSEDLTRGASLWLLEYLFSQEPSIVVGADRFARSISEWNLHCPNFTKDQVAAFDFECRKCAELDPDHLYPFCPDGEKNSLFSEVTPLSGGLVTQRPAVFLERLLQHHPCNLNKIGLKTTRGNFTPLQFVVSVDPEIHYQEEKQDPEWWEEAVLMLLEHGADPNCCPEVNEADNSVDETVDAPPPSAFLSFVQHPRATPQLMQKFIQCGANVSDPRLDQVVGRELGVFGPLCLARAGKEEK